MYPNRVSWTCNSYSYDRNTVYRSQLCEERTAHKETAAALMHTKDDLASLTWQIEQCKKELTETRNKLAAAEETIRSAFYEITESDYELSDRAWNTRCLLERHLPKP